jgi:hypothetical protein
MRLRLWIHNQTGRIARLSIDPITGAMLRYRETPDVPDGPISRSTLAKKVETILPQLQVGRRVWLGEHGRYWTIPLFWEGVLVTTVKVDTRTGELMIHRGAYGEDDG